MDKSAATNIVAEEIMIASDTPDIELFVRNKRRADLGQSLAVAALIREIIRAGSSETASLTASRGSPGVATLLRAPSLTGSIPTRQHCRARARPGWQATARSCR